MHRRLSLSLLLLHLVLALLFFKDSLAILWRELRVLTFDLL